MTKFFLSYSRSDQEFALRLASDLRNAGGSVWVDQFDILPSQRWDRAVDAAVRETNGLLLILSPRSVASENVLDEVSVAIESNRQIIPVLYEKCTLPLRLSRVQFIDATRDYESAFERCKAAVLGIKPPSPTVVDPLDIPPAIEPMPPPPVVPDPAPGGAFEKTFLDEVAKLLTFHLGPLARHIVAREQQGVTTREDLYQRLIAKVPAERERTDLLRKFRAL